MTVKDAIKKLNFTSSTSMEYSKVIDIYHNELLGIISEFLNQCSQDAKKHFTKILYGAEEEPNIKYVMTSAGVNFLNEYMFK